MTASDPRVGEIQARLDAATPGTWAWDGHVRRGLVSMRQATPILQCAALLYPAKPDAEFIAAAPADVAYLIAELRDRDEKLASAKAVALEEAADAIDADPYDDLDPFYVGWLKDRAEKIREGE